MLSEEAIKELGRILFEEYGETIEPTKLAEIARTFVGYFSLLARLDNKNNDDEK